MPPDPNAYFDQAVLDQIEHSPIGAVPFTPTYQDALKRLYASHQAYAHADHKNGHVTARSLAKLPHFQAKNLEELIAGRIGADAVAGKVAHHRTKHVGDDKVSVAHDPIHTLFLVPGTGPHPGLPGNYLHGAAAQLRASADSPWSVHLHDSDDGDALFETATMGECLAKLVEVLESAPFNTNELEALGFTLK